MRVGRRVPDGVVDAVQDAGDDGGASAQQAVEPHAALRRADLGGIGRRDGGDAVGELQPGLQEADAAEILHAVDRERLEGAAPGSASRAAGKWPWKARLCTVITVPGRARAVR